MLRSRNGQISNEITSLADGPSRYAKARRTGLAPTGYSLTKHPARSKNFFREPTIGGRVHPVQAMDRNRHPSPIGGNATVMGFGVAAQCRATNYRGACNRRRLYGIWCRPLPEWS